MNKWEQVLDNTHFNSSLEDIESYITKELNDSYSFDQFLADSEAFYLAYIDILGYNSGVGLNKKLAVRFHKVARILNLEGHRPDLIEEEAIDSVFKYLKEEGEQQSINKTAYAENSMDGPLQDHLVSLRLNPMPTSNVDFEGLIEEEEEEKELNVKVSSFTEFIRLLSDIDHIAALYKVDIKKIASIKFNRDKMLYSVNYK